MEMFWFVTRSAISRKNSISNVIVSCNDLSSCDNGDGDNGDGGDGDGGDGDGDKVSDRTS
jgi:hypothetical protein